MSEAKMPLVRSKRDDSAEGEESWPRAFPRVGKFAPVAPFQIYQQFMLHGYIPSTVLLLAHDVVKHAGDYMEVFQHSMWNNTHVIMDNSLVETGYSVDANMVFEAASIVGADTVVLPDVMGKGQESARITLKAWDEWAWKFRDFKKMVVLHGVNDSDWYRGAEAIKISGIKPDWLSIPRKCEDGNERRFKLVHKAQMIFGRIPIHLLGFSDFIGSDLIAAAHTNVKSIDSAVPLRLTTDAIISEDAGKRADDWFETASFSPEMITRCRLVDTYIQNLG